VLPPRAGPPLPNRFLAAACADECLKHRLNPIAEREVGVADDALGYLDWA
jgi:hypothetical protein